MNRDALVDEVIRNLESPVDPITFTPPLEEHYRSTIALDRRRSLSVASVIGLTILAAFVIERLWFADPVDDAGILRTWLATMAAIGAVVASLLGASAVSRSHRVLDRTIMLAMVITSVLVCASFRLDPTEVSTIGIYCYVMLPLAASSLASLHFRQALAVTVIGIAVYSLTLLTMPGLDPVIHVPALLLVVSVALMSLWANYRYDRDHRSLFLYLTRERLTAEVSLAQNAALRAMSSLDPLTGIANRRAFEDHFLVVSTEPPTRELALIMIDVDHFKAFNDHYGHPAGDRCLKTVAVALGGALRGPEDFLARIGGEEFAILAPSLDRAAAEAMLERLRRVIERAAVPHAGIAGRGDDVVTISLGCALVEAGDGDGRRDLLTRADRALYAAKRDGRNRWRID